MEQWIYCSDFARQLKAEANQREIGRLKNTNATVKAEQRSYASNTIYGQTILKHHTQLIAQEIKDRLHLLRRGKAAVDAVVVNKHLKEANHDTLAVIGMKVMLMYWGKSQSQCLLISLFRWVRLLKWSCGYLTILRLTLTYIKR